MKNTKKSIKIGGIKLSGETIYLRELDEHDASTEYRNWINDSSINRYIQTKKTTIEELKQYIRERMERPDCLFLGIFTKNSNKHIGNIKLEPLKPNDFENKKVALGILIGDKTYWGHGVCTEAVKLLVDYSFKNFDLDIIELEVNAENKAAIQCYLKTGFKIDDTKPGAIEHGQRFYDLIFMSVKKPKKGKNGK